MVFFTWKLCIALELCGYGQDVLGITILLEIQMILHVK